MSATRWPQKRLARTRGRQAVNVVMNRLVSWNLLPHTVMLTTTGRRSGTERCNPVTWVSRQGRLYLVAPYGPVGWVLNARAVGQVTLTGKQVAGRYAVRELPFDEAGPVIRDYLDIASATRPYFAATRGDPVDAFVREAPVHPVFELTRVEAAD